MPDETILLAIYKENADQARQHELFRQTITTLVGGITGAVIGLLSLKDTLLILRSPLLPVAGSFLAIIGIFGLIASMKHYERHQLHIQRMRGLRNELEQLPTNSTTGRLTSINTAANAIHNPRFPILHKTELNKVWNTFHLLVIALGITLCVIAYEHRNDPPPTTPTSQGAH